MLQLWTVGTERAADLQAPERQALGTPWRRMGRACASTAASAALVQASVASTYTIECTRETEAWDIKFDDNSFTDCYGEEVRAARPQLQLERLGPSTQPPPLVSRTCRPGLRRRTSRAMPREGTAPGERAAGWVEHTQSPPQNPPG